MLQVTISTFRGFWVGERWRDSRAWQAACGACGDSRSVWDMGGIRWKAVGDKWLWLRCPKCGKGRWHRLRKA